MTDSPGSTEETPVEVPFQRVAESGSIPEGECKDFVLEGGSVLVCNVEGTLYAVADICSHDGGPLGESKLLGCNVECARHGATFDVRTGKATALPAVKPIGAYAVREVDGHIEVQYEPPKKPVRRASSRPSPFPRLNR